MAPCKSKCPRTKGMKWPSVKVQAAVAVILAVTAYGHASGDHELVETWQEYQHRVTREAKQTGKIKAKSALELHPELSELHHRQKRTIAFPTGSTLTLTPILCIPVFSMGDVSGVLDLELPFAITLPNTSDVNLFGRSNDRIEIYSLVEESLDRFGMSGRACLLRAVCEVAESPLRDDGLLGEVLNIVLTASVGADSDTMQDYVKAEYRGKHYGDCWSAYPDCPVSIFKMLNS